MRKQFKKLWNKGSETKEGTPSTAHSPKDTLQSSRYHDHIIQEAKKLAEQSPKPEKIYAPKEIYEKYRLGKDLNTTSRKNRVRKATESMAQSIQSIAETIKQKDEQVATPESEDKGKGVATPESEDKGKEVATSESEDKGKEVAILESHKKKISKLIELANFQINKAYRKTREDKKIPKLYAEKETTIYSHMAEDLKQWDQFLRGEEKEQPKWREEYKIVKLKKLYQEYNTKFEESGGYLNHFKGSDFKDIDSLDPNDDVLKFLNKLRSNIDNVMKSYFTEDKGSISESSQKVGADSLANVPLDKSSLANVPQDSDMAQFISNLKKCVNEYKAFIDQYNQKIEDKSKYPNIDKGDTINNIDLKLKGIRYIINGERKLNYRNSDEIKNKFHEFEQELDKRVKEFREANLTSEDSWTSILWHESNIMALEDEVKNAGKGASDEED